MEKENLNTILKRYNDKKISISAKRKDLIVQENRFISPEKHKAILENKHFPSYKINELDQLGNIPLKNFPNATSSNFYQTGSNFYRSSEKFFSTIRSKGDTNNFKEIINDNADKIEPQFKNMNSTFNSRIPDFLASDLTNLLSCYFVNKNKLHRSNSTYDKLAADKVTKSKLLEKYRITKKLNEEVKDNIERNFSSKKSRNINTRGNSSHTRLTQNTKLVIREEYFKDPFKAVKKMTINKQIVDNINNILNEKIIEAYIDKIKDNENFSIKLRKMPGIKETYVEDKNEKEIVKHNSHIENKSKESS